MKKINAAHRTIKNREEFTMTLANAIRELMGKGISNFVGWTAQAALENAISIEATAKRVIETGIGNVESWQYTIDHADDNFIIETNGHHIIATWYETSNGASFCMATYGDYDTDEELQADFDAWKIATEAAEIADRMERERPGEFPRAAWLAIATAELKSAYAKANAAFEKEFGKAV
jgi:hypothetical protein